MIAGADRRREHATVVGLLAVRRAARRSRRSSPSAETALTHLGRAQAAALAEDGDPRAAELARLLEHRERVLNPVLLVLLVCQLAAATIVAVLAADRWGPAGVLASFVVETS